ncbi:hypothetical protein N2382_07750 [SAR92 clade bacterium H921]|nr:hypothetical protein [SAR92 clade bacterium H921]
MALSAYMSAVNQKLLFAAQLLATDIKASLSGQQDSHQVTAIAQSVTLQLQRAWCWHLQDVAANYKMQDPEAVIDATSLRRLLAEEGKTPGEAIELHELETDEKSWVGQLLNAHRHLYVVPVARRAEMDANRLPMIAVDISGDSIDWDIEQARLWFERMQELVDRQRDMMIEF